MVALLINPWKLINLKEGEMRQTNPLPLIMSTCGSVTTYVELFLNCNTMAAPVFNDVKQISGLALFWRIRA